MFWTNLATAIGTLALAFVTAFVTYRDIKLRRDERQPFVRADATDQEASVGSGVHIAMTKCTLEPEVRLINLGNYPVHFEAAMWWSDRMCEEEGVIPRTQRLSLTIPSGANVVAHCNLALTISEWGWLRFYFRNGATNDKYTYIEVPMFLDKYADEATYGYDDSLSSYVLFNFERQKMGTDTAPWHEARQTFRAPNGRSLFDDEQLDMALYKGEDGRIVG